MSRFYLQSGDRQDLSSGDRSSVSVTDRLPSELPARPSFWISGIDEPNPPSVGSGDEKPTNLAGYSDVLADQASSGDQPTWQDGYWNFDGDFWEAVTYEENPTEQTLAFVYQKDGGVNELQDLFNHEPPGGGPPAVRIRVDDGEFGHEVRAAVDDSDGNTGRLTLTEFDQTEGKVCCVLSYSSAEGTITLYAVGASGEVVSGDTSESYTGDFQSSQQYIGKLFNGARPFEGRIYEMVQVPSRMTSNQIEGYLIPWLKDRHGIGQTSAKPLTTRIPTSLPANPDIWIDASSEPAAPGDGQGDERPTNRAVYSDIDVSQSGGTSQPIWKGAYWEFGGDDYWEFENFDENPDELTWVVVASVDDISEDQNRVFSHRASFNPYINLYIRSNRIVMGARAADNTNVAGSIQPKPFGDGELFYAIGTFAVTGDGFRVRFWCNGKYREDAVVHPDPDFTSPKRTFGKHGAAEEFLNGEVERVMQFPKELSKNQIHNHLIPYLKEKHNV